MTGKMGEVIESVLDKNGAPSTASVRSNEIGEVNGMERKVRELLASAGVRVNGTRPWDMQVHDHRLYGRIMRQGSLGVGEPF